MTFKSKIKKNFEVRDVHVIKCRGIDVLKQMGYWYNGPEWLA